MSTLAVPSPRLAALFTVLLVSACGSDDSSMDASHADDASADGSAPSDAAVDSSLPDHCDQSVSEASVCIGRVRGRAGERVTIPVYLALPEGCTHTTQSGGRLVPSAPIGTFVAHPLRAPDCWTVQPTGDAAGFAFLTESAEERCPVSFPPGHLMDIQVDLAAGVAPGDYTLDLPMVNVGDNIAVMSEGGCRGKGAIAGRLTVQL